jgi:hypothetical protein
VLGAARLQKVGQMAEDCQIGPSFESNGKCASLTALPMGVLHQTVRHVDPASFSVLAATSKALRTAALLETERLTVCPQKATPASTSSTFTAALVQGIRRNNGRKLSLQLKLGGMKARAIHRYLSQLGVCPSVVELGLTDVQVRCSDSA